MSLSVNSHVHAVYFRSGPQDFYERSPSKMTIADIFADAQKSSINHKTLIKRLRKIEKKNESNRSRFEEQVKQCVLRCLEVSKPEKSGQNVVKFICSYCAAVESQERENEDEEGNN